MIGKNMKKGFSLVEALISLAVALVFFVAAFEMMFAIRNTVLSTNLFQEAEIYAKNNLYNASQLLLKNFYATTSSEVISPMPFIAHVQINDITQCRRVIESRVAWGTDASNKIHEVTFSSLIGSFDALKFLGNDCGGNDFANSVATSTPLSGTPLFLGSEIKLTGVDIFNHKAYASAISSNNFASDLFVVGVDENFHTISSLDFGVGVNNLDVASGYVFAAQNSSTSQFAIVDVRNPASPFLLASTTLPGVSGSRPQGWSVYYYDSKIYIGTRRTAGNEFHIYDVSNPANPVWLGSREMNHNINAIVVRDGIAYLATSGNTKDVIVLDVHNPTNIVEKASLDLPGSEDGKSLYLLGNVLYLGRFKSLNNSGHHEFYALDISNMSTRGVLSILGFYDTHADVNAIKVFGKYAFLGISDTEHEFSIINIASSSAIGFVNDINFSAKITGIDYESGVLTATSFDSGELYQIQL